MILADKGAVVTGGTSGIGAGIAELFASEGARVLIAGRNKVRGEEVVSRITKNGGVADFVKADVSLAAEVNAMVKYALKRSGSIDILVNNAGIQLLGGLAEMSEREWDTMFDTNVKGTFLCSRAVIPQMVRNGEGCIINIGSIAGLRGYTGGAIYSASKAAVISLTKAMAIEYGKAGIRVNCICPGSVETPMMQGYLKYEESKGHSVEGLRRSILKGIPAGRIGVPLDVAKLALYLASPDANFVNGGVFVIDGGAIAGLVTS